MSAILVGEGNDGRGGDIGSVEENVPECRALGSEIGSNAVKCDGSVSNDSDRTNDEARVVGFRGSHDGDVLLGARCGGGSASSGHGRWCSVNGAGQSARSDGTTSRAAGWQR